MEEGGYCAKPQCQYEQAENWVQCGRCSLWLHFPCAGWPDEPRDLSAIDFVCECCSSEQGRDTQPGNSPAAPSSPPKVRDSLIKEGFRGKNLKRALTQLSNISKVQLERLQDRDVTKKLLEKANGSDCISDEENTAERCLSERTLDSPTMEGTSGRQVCQEALESAATGECERSLPVIHRTVQYSSDIAGPIGKPTRKKLKSFSHSPNTQSNSYIAPLEVHPAHKHKSNGRSSRGIGLALGKPHKQSGSHKYKECSGCSKNRHLPLARMLEGDAKSGGRKYLNKELLRKCSNFQSLGGNTKSDRVSHSKTFQSSKERKRSRSVNKDDPRLKWKKLKLQDHYTLKEYEKSEQTGLKIKLISVRKMADKVKRGVIDQNENIMKNKHKNSKSSDRTTEGTVSASSPCFARTTTLCNDIGKESCSRNTIVDRFGRLITLSAECVEVNDSQQRHSRMEEETSLVRRRKEKLDAQCPVGMSVSGSDEVDKTRTQKRLDKMDCSQVEQCDVRKRKAELCDIWKTEVEKCSVQLNDSQSQGNVVNGIKKKRTMVCGQLKCKESKVIDVNRNKEVDEWRSNRDMGMKKQEGTGMTDRIIKRVSECQQEVSEICKNEQNKIDKEEMMITKNSVATNEQFSGYFQENGKNGRFSRKMPSSDKLHETGELQLSSSRKKLMCGSKVKKKYPSINVIRKKSIGIEHENNGKGSFSRVREQKRKVRIKERWEEGRPRKKMRKRRMEEKSKESESEWKKRQFGRSKTVTQIYVGGSKKMGEGSRVTKGEWSTTKADVLAEELSSFVAAMEEADREEERLRSCALLGENYDKVTECQLPSPRECMDQESDQCDTRRNSSGISVECCSDAKSKEGNHSSSVSEVETKSNYERQPVGNQVAISNSAKSDMETDALSERSDSDTAPHCMQEQLEENSNNEQNLSVDCQPLPDGSEPRTEQCQLYTINNYKTHGTVVTKAVATFAVNAICTRQYRGMRDATNLAQDTSENENHEMISDEMNENHEVRPNELKENHEVRPSEMKENHDMTPDGMNKNHEVQANEVNEYYEVRPDKMKGSHNVKLDEMRGNQEGKPDEMKENQDVRPDEMKGNHEARSDEMEGNHEVRPDKAKENHEARPDEVNENHEVRPETTELQRTRKRKQEKSKIHKRIACDYVTSDTTSDGLVSSVEDLTIDELDICTIWRMEQCSEVDGRLKEESRAISELPDETLKLDKLDVITAKPTYCSKKKMILCSLFRKSATEGRPGQNSKMKCGEIEMEKLFNPKVGGSASSSKSNSVDTAAGTKHSILISPSSGIPAEQEESGDRLSLVETKRARLKVLFKALFGDDEDEPCELYTVKSMNKTSLANGTTKKGSVGAKMKRKSLVVQEAHKKSRRASECFYMEKQDMKKRERRTQSLSSGLHNGFADYVVGADPELSHDEVCQASVKNSCSASSTDAHSDSCLPVANYSSEINVENAVSVKCNESSHVSSIVAPAEDAITTVATSRSHDLQTNSDSCIEQHQAILNSKPSSEDNLETILSPFSSDKAEIGEAADFSGENGDLEIDQLQLDATEKAADGSKGATDSASGFQVADFEVSSSLPSELRNTEVSVEGSTVVTLLSAEDLLKSVDGKLDDHRNGTTSIEETTADAEGTKVNTEETSPAAEGTSASVEEMSVTTDAPSSLDVRNPAENTKVVTEGMATRTPIEGGAAMEVAGAISEKLKTLLEDTRAVSQGSKDTAQATKASSGDSGAAAVGKIIASEVPSPPIKGTNNEPDSTIYCSSELSKTSSIAENTNAKEDNVKTVSASEKRTGSSKSAVEASTTRACIGSIRVRNLKSLLAQPSESATIITQPCEISFKKGMNLFDLAELTISAYSACTELTSNTQEAQHLVEAAPPEVRQSFVYLTEMVTVILRHWNHYMLANKEISKLKWEVSRQTETDLAEKNLFRSVLMQRNLVKNLFNSCSLYFRRYLYVLLMRNANKMYNLCLSVGHIAFAFILLQYVTRMQDDGNKVCEITLSLRGGDLFPNSHQIHENMQNHQKDPAHKSQSTDLQCVKSNAVSSACYTSWPRIPPALEMAASEHSAELLVNVTGNTIQSQTQSSRCPASESDSVSSCLMRSTANTDTIEFLSVSSSKSTTVLTSSLVTPIASTVGTRHQQQSNTGWQMPDTHLSGTAKPNASLQASRWPVLPAAAGTTSNASAAHPQGRQNANVGCSAAVQQRPVNARQISSDANNIRPAEDANHWQTSSCPSSLGRGTTVPTRAKRMASKSSVARQSSTGMRSEQSNVLRNELSSSSTVDNQAPSTKVYQRSNQVPLQMYLPNNATCHSGGTLSIPSQAHNDTSYTSYNRIGTGSMMEPRDRSQPVRQHSSMASSAYCPMRPRGHSDMSLPPPLPGQPQLHCPYSHSQNIPWSVPTVQQPFNNTMDNVSYIPSYNQRQNIIPGCDQPPPPPPTARNRPYFQNENCGSQHLNYAAPAYRNRSLPVHTPRNAAYGYHPGTYASHWNRSVNPNQFPFPVNQSVANCHQASADLNTHDRFCPPSYRPFNAYPPPMIRPFEQPPPPPPRQDESHPNTGRTGRTAQKSQRRIADPSQTKPRGSRRRYAQAVLQESKSTADGCMHNREKTGSVRSSQRNDMLLQDKSGGNMPTMSSCGVACDVRVPMECTSATANSTILHQPVSLTVGMEPSCDAGLRQGAMFSSFESNLQNCEPTGVPAAAMDLQQEIVSSSTLSGHTHHNQRSSPLLEQEDRRQVPRGVAGNQLPHFSQNMAACDGMELQANAGTSSVADNIPGPSNRVSSSTEVLHPRPSSTSSSPEVSILPTPAQKPSPACMDLSRPSTSREGVQEDHDVILLYEVAAQPRSLSRDSGYTTPSPMVVLDAANENNQNGGNEEPIIYCAICNNIAEVICSGCRRKCYCSEACQYAHWEKVHRDECVPHD